VVGGETVAVGDHQQQRQARDAAAEVPDEVGGGVVRPVEVLDHQRPGAGAQRLEHGGEHLVRRRPLGEQRADGRPEGMGDVVRAPGRPPIPAE
jgi:hypothetical protein